MKGNIYNNIKNHKFILIKNQYLIKFKLVDPGWA